MSDEESNETLEEFVKYMRVKLDEFEGIYSQPIEGKPGLSDTKLPRDVWLAYLKLFVLLADYEN